MKRLFEAAGVDYVQWRALMRAYTLTDFSAARGAYGDAPALRAIRDLVLAAVAFTFVGLVPAVVIWLAGDALFAATVMTSATAWLAGMTVLSRSSSIVTPDDHEIIGFRPVSSRTYFVVRLTALVSQAFEAAVLSGVLPVLAFATRSGGSWRLAAAAALAILGSALSVTVALVAVHGWLLRLIRPSRLARVLVYTQAVSFVVFMAAYFAAFIRFARIEPSGISVQVATVLPRSAWTLSYPGTWFASYVEIAGGHAGRFEIIAAALSVILLLGFATTLGGRLSARYAVHVAEFSAEPGAGAGRPGRAWSFLQPETRAMLILILGHLRSDVATQMGAVTALLTGGMLIGMSFIFRSPGGQPLDPDLTVAPFALFLLPVMFRESLLVSETFEASWPFFTTPSDRGKLVRASRDIVAVLVLAPALVVVTGLSIHAFRQVGHALLQSVILGATAYVVLQLNVLVHPALPCSVPPLQRHGRFGQALVMMPIFLTGPAILAAFQFFLYASPARVGLGIAALVGLIAGLDWLTRRRLAGRAVSFGA
jgi:hypothetical protein